MSGLQGDWAEALKSEFNKPYYISLYKFIKEEYKTRQIFPKSKDIFNAMHLTPLKEVKVVILGQDPYHDINQAMGLCFSVNKGIAMPPSLVNIFKELSDDLGINTPSHGDLTSWAKQGVLLLNTVLTVRAHEANSHRDKGWETFTDKIIETVDNKKEPVVFLLWGAFAQKKEILLNNKNHLVLKASHPSPLSAYRGFFGCKHFSKTNEFMASCGISPIDWSIPED